MIWPGRQARNQTIDASAWSTTIATIPAIADFSWVTSSRRSIEGYGFGTEAIRAVLSYGTEELNIHKVEALIHPDNLASVRLAEVSAFAEKAVRCLTIGTLGSNSSVS